MGIEPLPPQAHLPCNLQNMLLTIWRLVFKTRFSHVRLRNLLDWKACNEGGANPDGGKKSGNIVPSKIMYYSTNQGQWEVFVALSWSLKLYGEKVCSLNDAKWICKCVFTFSIGPKVCCRLTVDPPPPCFQFQQRVTGNVFRMSFTYFKIGRHIYFIIVIELTLGLSLYLFNLWKYVLFVGEITKLLTSWQNYS